MSQDEMASQDKEIIDSLKKFHKELIILKESYKNLNKNDYEITNKILDYILNKDKRTLHKE